MLIKAKYLDTSGTSRETLLGQYPVEAVKFDKGVAYIKVAGEYVAMDSVLEFTEPVTYSSNQNNSSNNSSSSSSNENKENIS